MSKYIEIVMTRAELATVHAILNDSGMSFKHMSKTHHSVEQRAADTLGVSQDSVTRLATDVWRQMDRALERSRV